jgi:hypothetical protein
MADPLALVELELRIALLPPISRGTHIGHRGDPQHPGGPRLHAQRLVDLWKVENDDDVPLAQAFRLLDVETIAAVILRTAATGDYSGNPRHWTLPPLTDMLADLQACAWQAALDGVLAIDGLKGVRGTRRQRVLPAELPRLAPDRRLPRLVRDDRDDRSEHGDRAERDECDDCDDQSAKGDGGANAPIDDVFIDVRVRRAPAEPVKATWRPDKPRQQDADAAMDEIAREYPTAREWCEDDPRPAFDEIWGKLKAHCGDTITRAQARAALKTRAPHLIGHRGRAPKK